MADDEAAPPPAAAAAAAPAGGAQARQVPPDVAFKVPAFTGLETRVQVETFLQKIEACIARIQDAPPGANQGQIREVERKKARTFIMGFQDRAHTWVKKWKRENPDQVENYDVLVQAFKDRYLTTPRMTDVNEQMTSMKQKQDETVEDFFDRCHEVACTLMDYDNTPQAIRADDNFKRARDRFLINAFVTGIKPAYKEKVAQHANKTAQELLDESKLIEAAYKANMKGKNEKFFKKKGAPEKGKKLAEIETEEHEEEENEDEEEEKGEITQLLEEIRKFGGFQRNRGNFRGRGGRGRGRGRGGRSFNNNNNNGPRGRGRNGSTAPFTCDLCNQYGHGVRWCPQLAQMKRQRQTQGQVNEVNQQGNTPWNEYDQFFQ